MAVHNALTAGLSLTVETYLDGTWTTRGTYGSIGDENPLMGVFDDVSASRVRITLNYTSKLYIGYMSLGKAVKFPFTPSLGLNRPQYSRLDRVDNFSTAGNNVTRSRVRVRGNVARGSFDVYKMSDLDEWYSEYINHVYEGKAVFFRFSNVVDDVIYGRQNPSSLADITYQKSAITSFTYEFIGYTKR